jgi:hypothetical protein
MVSTETLKGNIMNFDHSRDLYSQIHMAEMRRDADYRARIAEEDAAAAEFVGPIQPLFWVDDEGNHHMPWVDLDCDAVE